MVQKNAKYFRRLLREKPAAFGPGVQLCVAAALRCQVTQLPSVTHSVCTCAEVTLRICAKGMMRLISLQKVAT